MGHPTAMFAVSKGNPSSASRLLLGVVVGLLCLNLVSVEHHDDAGGDRVESASRPDAPRPSTGTNVVTMGGVPSTRRAVTVPSPRGNGDGEDSAEMAVVNADATDAVVAEDESSSLQREAIPEYAGCDVSRRLTTTTRSNRGTRPGGEKVDGSKGTPPPPPRWLPRRNLHNQWDAGGAATLTTAETLVDDGDHNAQRAAYVERECAMPRCGQSGRMLERSIVALLHSADALERDLGRNEVWPLLADQGGTDASSSPALSPHHTLPLAVFDAEGHFVLPTVTQLRPYYGHAAIGRFFRRAGDRLPVGMKWFSDDEERRSVLQSASRRRGTAAGDGPSNLSATATAAMVTLRSECMNECSASMSPDAADQQPSNYVDCKGRRNAVLGYAVTSPYLKYSRDLVQGFIESFLRYAGACDDLVLIGDSWLMNSNFTSSSSTGKGRVIIHNAASLEKPRVGHPFVDRLWVFQKWIQMAWRRYHYIIQADTRDTIFFANPFELLYRVRLDGLFSATEVHLFRNQEINRQWVETHYDDKVNTVPFFVKFHLYMQGRAHAPDPIPVLCSGIYGGTSLAVADYIQAFVAAVERTKDINAIHGMDQGIHIALQYVELAMAGYHHPIYAIDFRVGPYRHWYSEDERVRRDVLGRHLNCLGQTYAIVHQLDRYRDHHFNDVNSDYSVRGTRAAPAVAPGAPVTRTFGDADRFDAPSREWLQSRAAVVRRAAANARRSMRGAAPARRLLRPSGVCRARHVALAFVEPNTAHFGAVQAFVAAYQRYHPACDDLVLFVASAVWMDALARDESGGSGNVVGVVYPHGARPGVSFVDWLARYGGRYDGIAAFDSVAAPPVSIFGNVFTGTGLSTATRTAAARTPGIVYAVHDPAFAAGCGWSPGTVGTPLMPGVFLGTTPAAVDWLATQNDLGADSGREWCANASVAARSLIAGSLFPLVSRSALVVLAGPMAAVQVVGPGAASPWGQDHAGRPLHAGGGVVAAVVGEGGVRAEFLKDYRVRHSKFPSACFTSNLK